MVTRVHGDLRVTRGLTIPAAELDERFSRSSGPGGQRVNTTDSRVALTFDPAASQTLSDQQRERIDRGLAHRLSSTGLTVVADGERSQLANRREARRRMAELLGEALSPPAPARRPTRPGQGAKRRRLASKRHRSAIKRTRGKAGRDEE